MMYMTFIIDHIHHLINESKILIFAYNSNQVRYMLKLFPNDNTQLKT